MFRLNEQTLVVTLKSQQVALTGEWFVEDAKAEVETSGSAPAYGFDHLINLQGTNHVIHPDDITYLQGFISQDQTSAPAKLKLRIIGPDRNIKTLYSGGHVSVVPTEFSVYEFDTLISTKNLLEAVFNTSSLGLHVLKSVRDESGSIIDFDIVLTNETSDRIAGRRVSGMRMLEGWPHTKQIGLFDKFVSTVETGAPLLYQQLYEADGVTAWFEWMASRFNDGLYVTIEDVTKRKNDEEALKRSADCLQSIFDGVPAIISLLEVLKDTDDRPVDFLISATNKALLDFTGAKMDDLVGKRMTDLFPDAFRGELLERYINVYLHGEPLTMEFLYPGRNRWFSIFVTKQVDGKGIVVVALEITDQKKAEEQKKQNQILAALDQAKTEFFSNVSHEFRTPLTLMLGPVTDILKHFEEKKFAPEDFTKLLMVKRNALRLQKLVNSLLDFAQIEAGRKDATFQPTDLAKYTELLASTFRSAIEGAGLKFSVNCAETEPIYISHDMWEKIVLNLLSNAFKFTFEGTIELKLKSYKKHVQLHIRDTGIGISADNMDKIFERFLRVQNTKSRTQEGTGIGLALVKELVHIHGGEINVESEIDKGTLFIVSIPKGKAHLPARNIYESKNEIMASPLSHVYGDEATNWLLNSVEEPDTGMGITHLPPPDTSSPGRRRVVLLVDDNADIREYIKGILHRDYIVMTAHHGKRALELIAAGLKPDLVLADVMMPEMDGFSLLGEMKNHQTLKQVPFVFLSARASESSRLGGLAYGADDFLIKPFSSAELLARVSAGMRRSPISGLHV